jgi:hypothetical protein
MEDDYGDRTISGAFYSGGISREQKRVANRTRNMIEGRVGRFSTLKSLVGGTGAGTQEKRANNLFTRVITVPVGSGDRGSGRVVILQDKHTGYASQ